MFLEVQNWIYDLMFLTIFHYMPIQPFVSRRCFGWILLVCLGHTGHLQVGPIMGWPGSGGQQLAEHGMLLLLPPLPNSYCDVSVSMAGPSPAARLKTTATAACATHLSRRERVRVHVPNEAGGSQAACVSTLQWPPLFTGAGVATATSTGWHNRGGLLPMCTPPPLPCPLTSHTIRPSCLALTSLGLHCQLLLLLC